MGQKQVVSAEGKVWRPSEVEEKEKQRGFSFSLFSNSELL